MVNNRTQTGLVSCSKEQQQQQKTESRAHVLFIHQLSRVITDSFKYNLDSLVLNVTVRLLGCWFSHICKVCDIQKHLLMANILVLAHGHNCYSWKTLIWGKRRNELVLFLAYEQNVICQLCINADVHYGSLTMEHAYVTSADSGYIPVWAVSFWVPMSFYLF